MIEGKMYLVRRKYQVNIEEWKCVRITEKAYLIRTIYYSDFWILKSEIVEKESTGRHWIIEQID